MTKWTKHLVGILPLIAIMWGVFFVNQILPGIDLNHLGIIPRRISGLVGVICSPFLHANWMHLVSNTMPLLTLPVLLSISEGRRKMWKIVWLGILISGLFTWVVGTSNTLVVGASGLVFVLIGYLLADCFFHPCARSVPIGIITLIFFGGSVFSLYHFQANISLAGHAGGLLAGILLAKRYGK